MLTKRQFEVLVLLVEEGKSEFFTQREIAQRTKMSLGLANNVINQLVDLEYVVDNKVTEKGLKVLENYKVQRAVFIAAGFGSRLVPITLNTPKPLVRVNGTRLIDTLLDAVVAAGIEEIYIVRGYLAEQFDILLKKYPTIKFIENPVYNETNNISSAFYAKSLLSNSYILEADLFLSNPKLISKYQYETNYLGIPTERTDDWCFLSESGTIKKVSIGGLNCHEMVGISYWTKDDGEKLESHIDEVFHSPGGKEKFWDLVALDTHLNEYKISIRECESSDVVEIDTFRELKELDKTYDV